ncbi:cob(I)yrinic acid a,c-diamide adenosyltransferase [Alicyclobacillus cycloheptanicus]|uniref:Corrinoid adenosyltransferase n=1 Tax=Alicyclobacillus cycloheptanicus TaxID=1457 RepID=A0ABT9XFM8_9BACL|nr:cob(I)yrinic acid a,c-diamide adenosyltransferase [Alicyclobacillus cycloheptanicus]MDQ0189101.1 cob(I)alamin adenosyltransferase [Alicyclobacillus cycloheptanicus]WDM00232.1 cob(I)yrinic acid a,c-diamide adenosyltransferase [Alicyclobacillus cycloheptanicus]
MRMYTRGGDRGQTALIGGVRRYKDDVRVEAYGSVDEAGAFLGLAASHLEAEGHQDIVELLLEVQQTLWDVGADLAAAKTDAYVFRTQADAAAKLEPVIDKYQEEAEKVTKFVLRGGSIGSSYLHVACTVVRRAERAIVRLMRQEAIHQPALTYINRLSDLLFVLARAANARANQPDVVYRNSTEVFRG